MAAQGEEIVNMSIGTRSVLFGAHCFLLHPFCVAIAWWKIYGVPFDPRLWFAFFLHDLGYIGKPNMDGVEGETHPEFGAKIMGFLFDRNGDATWHDFTLYHSRYYAKKCSAQYSRLAVADKLAFCVLPRWIYLHMVNLSGEIHEYMPQSIKSSNPIFAPMREHPEDQRVWWNCCDRYFREWVETHKDGRADMVTKTRIRETTS